MKQLIAKLKPRDPESGHWNVIIETPKGSRVKYAYDPESGFMILSKALPEGMMFPFNFGFIPQTLSEDGDPLDVLILNEEPLISGCLLRASPIAVIKAEQVEKAERKPVRNDRIIAQAMMNEAPAEFRALKLDKRVVTELEMFFANYNKLYGKTFKVLGTEGPAKANELIERAIKWHRKGNK